MDIFPAKANYTGKALFGKSTKAVNAMSAQEVLESLTAFMKHFNVQPLLMYSAFKGSAMKKSWLLLAMLFALPLVTHAEIYKWKDKDGAVRYSDVPPASNIPHQTLNGKSAIPASTPAAAPGTSSTAAPTPDEAALKRQQSAEQEKAQQQAKDNEQEVKKQNCMNAQTNMQKYKVGGRIMKMNAKGEREYLSDAEIKQGLEQAQKEIEQFCAE